MTAMKLSPHTGQVVWLGHVPHRDAAEIVSHPLTEMALGFAGYDGDTHAGLTRPACGRVAALYRRGTEIRNTRQVSLVSQTELTAIATAMGMDTIDPAWLGASVVVAGIPDFSHLPPSARLQGPDGVTLTVDMQNRPCRFPAMTIAKARPGQGDGFQAAARGLRGITAWVERPGKLRLGDTLALFVPDQRAWAPQGDLFSR